MIDWFSELYRIIKLISYGGVSKKLTAQLISALDETLSTSSGGSNTSVIDLGMVSLRDACINGRSVPLIPYAEGRLISSVRFVPSGQLPDNGSFDINFVTPNTADLQSGSVGFASVNAGDVFDIFSLIAKDKATNIFGVSTYEDSQIMDCGPLIAGNATESFLPTARWQPNTPYCGNDPVIDDHDHIRSITVNGVSGATEPAWVDSGPTIDNTCTWADDGLLPTANLHVLVEVVEGVSPMPAYPATLEWIAQPVDVVAGATMDDIRVIVKDQNGDPYTFRNLLTYLTILGAGTLNGTVQVNMDTISGIVTFTGLSITEPGTGYILRAMLNSLVVADPIFSDPFDVTAP